MNKPSSISIWRRYWRFNFVGVLGFVLQLSALSIWVNVVGVPYLLATLLAVESAVLHNFAWHERYTWLDRTQKGPRGRMKRFLAFHLTNGAVSFAGNLALMALLVGRMGLNLLFANIVSVLFCSAANFAMGNLVIFRGRDSDQGSRFG